MDWRDVGIYGLFCHVKMCQSIRDDNLWYVSMFREMIGLLAATTEALLLYRNTSKFAGRVRANFKRDAQCQDLPQSPPGWLPRPSS